MPTPAHNLWPSPGTTLLLRACLLEGDAARAAFEAWLASRPGGIAEGGPMHYADRRLLPLLAHNLRRAGVRHPDVDVAAGALPKTREKNQRLLAAAREALAALSAAGIATLALKGLPLLVSYYGDASLRPMSDVDLMVRAADRERAIACLATLGWRAEPCPSGLAPYLCAHELERGRGAELDLHQYLIEYGSTPDAEARLFAEARTIDLDGLAVRAPSAADLLLHVLAASLKFGRATNSRWVPDAVHVIRGGVDWERFVAAVVARAMVLPIRECLRRLVAIVPVDVPVLDTLERMPVGRFEATTYRALTTRVASAADLARDYLVRYRFAARACGERPSAVGFARYGALRVQREWHLAHAWQLAPAAVERGAKAVLGRVSRSARRGGGVAAIAPGPDLDRADRAS